jgi:hypothetical protein
VSVSHKGASGKPKTLDFLCPPAESTSPSPSEIGERPKRITLPREATQATPEMGAMEMEIAEQRRREAKRARRFRGNTDRGKKRKEARRAGAEGQVSVAVTGSAWTGTVVATWSWSGASGPSVPAGSGRVLLSCSARWTRGVHGLPGGQGAWAHEEVDGNGDHDAGVIA